MPISILSLKDAYANRKGEATRWPTDKESQAQRLLPIAKPAFDTPFKIKKSDLIFTTGSCFARNIEKQLAISGYEFAAKNFDLHHEDSDLNHNTSDVLNKYFVFSILNELRWALDPTASFSEENYVKFKGDKWWDPHLIGSIAPSSLARVRHRRTRVGEYSRGSLPQTFSS